MLIVLEGCDGAGKSTLIGDIERHLPPNMTDTEHLGPPGGDPLTECLDAIKLYTPGTGRHLLVDRLHIGEAVYGPIFRTESLLEGVGLGIVNQRLTALGGLLVFVDVPLEELQRRVSNRGDDYVAPKQLGEIRAGYHKIMSRLTDVTTITVDSRQPNTVTQILRIAAALEHEAAS